MTSEPGELDGTSQAGRVLAALDPGHVAVDERTVEELVAYVREYAKGLVYYGPDDSPAGDLGGLVGELSPAKVAAFLADPERFDPVTDPELFRPHFVLFLVFLKLLERAREQLNALTARHLDFYYREVLRMTRRRPVADRVNLVFALANEEREVMVPAGSSLAAGTDSLGKERVYTTDRDLVVTRAQIASVRSVFVDRRVTGYKEARERAETDEEAGLWMLRIALGDPLPGDPLPLYPDGKPVDAAKLKQLDALTQSTSDCLPLPELRELMRRRDIAGTLTGQARADAWTAIAEIIAGAGQRKRKDPAYRLPEGHDPTDFAANLDSALGPGSANDLKGAWAKILELEAYFFVDAGSFHRVAQQIRGPNEAVWDHVDAILDGAHKEKVRTERRLRLKQVGDALSPEARFARLIQEVMADPWATQDDLAPFCPDLKSLTGAVDRSDWERVYSILEVAQRNRIGEPPALQEEWLNLYPTADAPAAGARAAPPGRDESPRWATFGLRPEASRDAPPAPVLGWAVSSPLLSLREGSRTITLTLGLRAGAVDPTRLAELLASEPGPLRVELSTAEGWALCHHEVLSRTLPVDPEDPRGAELQLRFTVTMEASAAPLAAMPAALADVESPWPTLRLMLQPAWSEDLRRYRVFYRELGGLVVVDARLEVAVKGIKALMLQNDDGDLNPRKPFEPFGSSPSVGSRLLVGHPELVDRQLDALSFHVQWMKPPADLAAHYANYGLGSFAFTTRVSVVDRDEPTQLLAAAPLFDAENTGAPTTIAVPAPVPAPRTRAGDEPDDDLSTWPRYFQWELNAPDFQHGAHAEVVTRKANELAAAIANSEVATSKANALVATIASARDFPDSVRPEVTTLKADELAAAIANRGTIDASNYTVRPPYTPKLKALAVDYTASQEIGLEPARRDGTAARVYHVHPFGACDVEAERTPQGVPLLPRHDADGELYLGLSDVAAPQSVSILFQLAEGSADPDLAPQRVTWSYLSGDRWVDGRVIQDTTRGLLNTGIVELALGPAAPSTRVRGGLYWVRAAVARDTASVCDVIALDTQATSATFADQDNAPDHFREPLPPSTITGLAVEIPEIAGVRQPFTSHGGRPAEEGDRWATRVSERLRHRQRALSTWDYERLVLDRFPEIYKAKCVPARPDAPGEVRVIVIPDVRRLVPADPFEPRAPARLLAEIEGYLGARAPAFARVSVRNPRYVAVRLRLRVRFAEGCDEGYSTRRLHDEINRFLSPWAYKEGGDIALGGRIYANSVLDFVDRRPYVDYVAGLLLFRSEDGEHFAPAEPPPEGEGEFVAAGRPDAVLVAARTHVIDVVHDAVYEDHLTTGINFMRVELDFIVA